MSQIIHGECKNNILIILTGVLNDLEDIDWDLLV